MDHLTAARIQTVRDHMRLECEHDWDGVIATFAHPRLDDRQRIASLGKQSIEANKYQPIKNTKGKIPKDCLLGAARRKTLICCLSTQISASSVARARIRSTSVQKMSLQTSVIT